MTTPKLPYVGDAAIRRFLARHQCPAPLHVVRMRFWGAIISPLRDVSPIRTIESLWPDGLPVLDDAEAANRFFQTLIGLWNRMTRYQGGADRLALQRLPKLARADRAGLRQALTIRTEELHDGFMHGFCGGANSIDVPAGVRALLERVEMGTQIFYQMRNTLDAPPGPEGATMVAEIAKGLAAMDPLIREDLNGIAQASQIWRKAQVKELLHLKGGDAVD